MTPRKFDSPCGDLNTFTRLFDDAPIYQGVAMQGLTEYRIVMVDADYALDELTGVTMTWASAAGNPFIDQRGRRWYCYIGAIQLAALAWDHREFMERYNFVDGLALVTEQRLPDDWITIRRDAAYSVLAKTEFLGQFFAQYGPTT